VLDVEPARFQPLPEAGGAQLVGDPVLDAAAACIDRKGFDNTSLEEIAIEAGVSRATLYRRFGNRESLFKTLLLARAKPFQKWSTQILLGPGPIGARVETVLTHAILEMQRVGWLDRSLHAGMSPASIRLFKAAHAEGAENGLRPLLEALIGERARAAGVSIPEIIDGTADQMITLASGPEWTEAQLRKRLGFFVMRVLEPSEPPEAQIMSRLARIEASLERLAGGSEKQ